MVAQSPSAKSTTGISLILPMYNESAGVARTLQTAVAELDRDFADFEIIIADDASTDDSAAQVAAWAARDARIRLVRLPRNQRFGGALRAGLAAAGKQYLFYTDFDLQVGLDCLPAMLRELDTADVITGYSANQVKHTSWRSALISWGYNFCVRALFGLRLRDINFGFKALSKTVYAEMDLRSCSPFVDAEMFVQARRRSRVIKEVPVPFFLRQTGVSHIRRLDVIAATFWDMLRLRCRRL